MRARSSRLTAGGRVALARPRYVAYRNALRGLHLDPVAIPCGPADGYQLTAEALGRHYAPWGARFVAIGVDTSLLTQSARALASRFCGSGAAPAVPAY